MGSRGRVGDQKSLRLCSQASASVAHFWESKSDTLSSLLDLRWVAASQNCAQSQGSGGSRSRSGVAVAKCRTGITFGPASDLRVSKVSTVTGIGVVVVTKRSRHFWTRVGSSRLNGVNSHRDRGVVVAKRRTVVTFGLASCRRVSKVSTVIGIGGVVVAKRRTVVTFWLCLFLSHPKGVESYRDGGSSSRSAELTVTSVTGIGGVVVAKRRTVVTFGLVSSLRISKVSTVTGIGGVVVAKRRTVVTFGLASCRRVSKVSTVIGIGGVVVAKRRTVVTFWLCLFLSHPKGVESYRDGGSSSRSAELTVTSVTGIGGVVVAKRRTVVTFGLAFGDR